MKKSSKIKRFVIVPLVLAAVAAGGMVAKNIILDEVRGKIRSQLEYSRMSLSAFPPAVIIENARSVSTNPFIFARKITVQISPRALFSQNKPFHFVAEDPVVRFYPSSQTEERSGGKRFGVTFPFAIERGLVRNGQFYYLGEDIHLRSRGVHALFSQKKGRFTLRSEMEEGVFQAGDKEISGKLSLVLSGEGNQIEIKKLRFSGPEGVVKTAGKMTGLTDPRFDLEGSYTVKSGLPAGWLNLPFSWEGNVQGEGRLIRNNNGITFSGGLRAKSLVLNEVMIGEADGRVNFREGEKSSIEIDIRKPGRPAGKIDIEFDGRRVKGILSAVTLKPVAHELKLPWPISSSAWGRFILMDRRLTADARFLDETDALRGDLFPLQGQVHVEWDGEKNVEFSSKELSSSFAKMKLEGRLQIDRHLDLSLQGDVEDVAQARRFTELILQKKFTFPEIRGRGSARLDIFGLPKTPQLDAEFTLSPGGFDRFDAAFVEGEAELIQNDFFGRFEIEAPDYSGRVALFTDPGETRVNVRLDRGRTEIILPALNIPAPLTGEASGRFEYVQKEDETYAFQGNYAGDRIRAAGVELTSVSGGIKGDHESLDFTEVEFRYWDGEIRGRAFFHIPEERFDVNLEGKGLDFSSVSASVRGLLDFQLRGIGRLGEDMISGSYQINEFLIPPFSSTQSKGDVEIGYTFPLVRAGVKGGFFPGDNPLEIEIEIPVNGDTLEGQAKGHFDNLDILFPWKGAEGRLNYLIEARGNRESPRFKGVIDFQGEVLPFPRFAHALQNYSGLLFVDNGDLSLRSFQADFGGGRVQADGRIQFDLSGVRSIDIQAEGENMTLSPLERSRALTDGSLHLLKKGERFVLGGEFLIERMFWMRELDEGFAFSSTAFPESDRPPGFFDDLTLNIRLRADDNAWIENSIGQIHGKLDLTIAGNVFNPVVLGEIEAIEGSVFFQDREFNVIQGKVSFFNPGSIEPFLNFKGETHVKDYHVTFSLEGLPGKLNPEFSSSPPLPPEDVLALLAVGEAFRRTYHYDRTTGQSTASLLSFSLSEEAKKRAEQLFKIDRFRIDPFIMGSSPEMTARLTLGKKLSRNFFILYSTNLASQREEITRIEWELSKDFSIVGTRDETGRVSFDVKVYKRF
ncbi:MAG: translocation/assembly module TamB domain-containing protein [Candidatus Aminicenantaceae bacterium]